MKQVALVLAPLCWATAASAQRVVPTVTPTVPDLRITVSSKAFASALITNIGRPALAMENGDLILLDWTTQQLSIFNRAGQRVSAAVRGLEAGKTLGSGGIGQVGDTIWVRAGGPPAQFNLLRSDFTFIRTIAPGNSAGSNPLTLLANNTTTILMPGSRPPNASPSIARYIGLAVTSPDGAPPRPIAWWKAATVPNSLRFDRTNVSTPAPLQDGVLFSPSPESDRIVILERFISLNGERSSYRLTTIRPNGDTLWHRSIPYTPLAVQPAMLDGLRGLTEVRGVGDSVIRALPRYVSPVADFFVGAGGIVWIGERTSQPYETSWLLFDSSGVEQVRLRLDFSHRPIAARGNDLWTVTTDITGTTSLNRFTIRVPR